MSSTKYYLLDEKGNHTELKHCSVYDEIKDTTTVQAIYGECGQSYSYGTFQTIYIEIPTMKFWKEEKNMRKDIMHDSIMKLKTKTCP